MQSEISEDRKKYLRKILFNKVAILGTQILIVVVLIVAWEILANTGVIDTSFKSYINRNNDWIYSRNSIRCVNCNYPMVVKLFIESGRTIFGYFKQST